MKQLSEITDIDCRNILTYVFDNAEYRYLSFYNKNETHHVLIFFNNGQDNCQICVKDSRVMLWLYENDFNIYSLLKLRKNDSLVQIEVDELMCDLLTLSKSTEYMEEKYRTNFTLDKVLIKCRSIFDSYFDISEKYEIV